IEREREGKKSERVERECERELPTENSRAAGEQKGQYGPQEKPYKMSMCFYVCVHARACVCVYRKETLQDEHVFLCVCVCVCVCSYVYVSVSRSEEHTSELH